MFDDNKDNKEIIEEDKFKFEEDKFKLFGYEFFFGELIMFVLLESVLVFDFYIVGLGDIFLVSLFGKEFFIEEVVIDCEGCLIINKFKLVIVSGM